MYCMPNATIPTTVKVNFLLSDILNICIYYFKLSTNVQRQYEAIGGGAMYYKQLTICDIRSIDVIDQIQITVSGMVVPNLDGYKRSTALKINTGFMQICCCQYKKIKIWFHKKCVD